MENNIPNAFDILPKILAQKNLAQEATASQILFDYTEMLKNKIADNSFYEVKFLKEKVIYVSVQNNSYGQKLHFINAEVLPELQKKYPEKVTEIRIRLENAN